MAKIGFLGLGIMGSAMARRLLGAGHDVTVYNRNPARAEPLADAGAFVATSPLEAARASDITLACVSDPEAALAVCLGPEGARDGLRPGGGYVDLSTVDADTSRRIAAAVEERGGRYLEAPVSGSKGPAEDGTLVVLAAGDLSLYEEALPILQVLAKKIVHLGEAGRGARMKLVVNMVMGSMMGAFAEGLALAERAGLPTDVLLEVLDAGAIANPMFRGKGRNILTGRYEPAFPLKHQQKDLRLARALGNELGQPLPIAAAADQLFVRARARGLGDADFSAVSRVVREP